MENLLELLRKYNMTNEDVMATSQSPLATTNLSNADMNMGVGKDMGFDSQSLLSDNKTNKTLSLMGLLSSPEALTGLGLISQGLQGKRAGEAILPSFVEGLKVSSAVRTMTKEQEQQKAIDEFADKVPEQYKPLFKAFPKETMKLLLTPKEPTLTGLEVKALEKVRAGLPLDPAEKILIDRLKQGNPINQLMSDIFSDPKIQEQIKKYASQNIDVQGKKTSETIETPKGKVTLTERPDPKSLVKNQIYSYQGKGYIWDGSNFKPQ